MGDYRSSDYALNKKSDAIVYRFNDGITIEITLDIYLEKYQDGTSEDFTNLKEQSDELYHQEDLKDGRHRKTIKALKERAHDLPTTSFQEESAESVFFKNNDQQKCNTSKKELLKRSFLKLAKEAINELTPTQRRRYLLHKVKMIPITKIAEMEGVKHPVVIKSIRSAEVKIMRYMGLL